MLGSRLTVPLNHGAHTEELRADTLELFALPEELLGALDVVAVDSFQEFALEANESGVYELCGLFEFGHDVFHPEGTASSAWVVQLPWTAGRCTVSARVCSSTP